MRVRNLLPRLVAASLVIGSSAARGAEWVVDSSVAARITHNDNLNMQAVDPVTATYLTLSPSLSLTSRTESRSIEVTASAGVNRHFENPKNDTIDQNLGGSLKLSRELNQFTLAVSRVRNSTQSSELAQTGVVTVRRQRTQNGVQAAWVHGFDESTLGNVALAATQIRYEQGPGLVDFDDWSVAAGLRRVLSERASVNATLTTRSFRTVTGDSRTRANGISLGGEWQYSERLGLSIDAGRQRTRSDQTLSGFVCPFGLPPCVPASVDIRSETTGSTFSGALGYKLESGTIGANLSSNLAASGTGALLRTDSGAISYSHRFSDTLNLNLGGTLTRSGSLDSVTATNRFSSLAASWNWQIDQWLSLSGGLTRYTQRAAGQVADTQANLIFLNLNWGFVPLSISR